MAFLQWVTRPDMGAFRGVIVRRTMTQVTGPGGVAETAQEIYQQFGAQWRVKDAKFIFPNKATIVCKGCEQEKDKHNFQGWQVSAFLVDEAQQFEESQVLYFISRMRTSAPMRPKLFMTANPDYNSFLRVWLEGAGYLDEDGLPRPEMDGVRTWFIRQGNDMIWGKSKEELIDRFGEECGPMSFVFLPATCRDNPVLLSRDKTYLYKLQSLPRVERMRLLEGSWYAREESSGYFQKTWVQPVRYYDQQFTHFVRAYDIAGSLPSETLPDPDWTAGVLMGKTKDGRYIVCDVERFRARYGEVMQRIIQIAHNDPPGTKILLPQEPAQAGKIAAQEMLKTLLAEGFAPSFMSTNKSKVIRFQPFAVAAENGLVGYTEGKWNDAYFSELEGFTGGRNEKNDQCDATSDAFAYLAQKIKLPNLLGGLTSGSITTKSTLPFS